MGDLVLIQVSRERPRMVNSGGRALVSQPFRMILFRILEVSLSLKPRPSRMTRETLIEACRSLMATRAKYSSGVPRTRSLVRIAK